MSEAKGVLIDCLAGFAGFRTIVVDPPWPYDEFCQIHSKAGRTVKPLPYGSMTVDEIRALPVAGAAAKDCRLWMWTTNRFLPDSFSVMAAWGFAYRQMVVWHKVGNPSPWGGSVAPNYAEFLLVGVRGKPARKAILTSNVWQANVSRHSAKPAAFLDMIEQASEGPYLEMFGRETRLGWVTIGNEVDGTDIRSSLAVLARDREGDKVVKGMGRVVKEFTIGGYRT